MFCFCFLFQKKMRVCFFLVCGCVGGATFEDSSRLTQLLSLQSRWKEKKTLLLTKLNFFSEL
jgi:hypothetical protein